MGWETKESVPGVNCDKKTEQPLELTLSAIDNWPLIVIMWSKLVEADRECDSQEIPLGRQFVPH